MAIANEHHFSTSTFFASQCLVYDEIKLFINAVKLSNNYNNKNLFIDWPRINYRIKINNHLRSGHSMTPSNIMRTTLSPHPSHDEDDFLLYLPNPTKQILLYDMATSSSVLTYIKMKGRTGSIRNLSNAEFISDDGRLPAVLGKSSGNKLMCGFSEVFWYLARELNYQPGLAELAYIDWVESHFIEAEIYICWCTESVLGDYTRTRCTYELPWPVSSILFRRKRAEMAARVGSKYQNFEDFLDKFNRFLKLLNKRIGSQNPDESYDSVDALVYAHTSAIIRTNLNSILVDAINKQRRIMNLKDFVDERYPS